MAIIQSILVGKGKGKIGNVVLSGLRGQTVAKQLNSSPKNPRSDAQIYNRVKMANAVLAWQFLANFLVHAKALRKPLESTYNAFVRLVKLTMPVILFESRKMAAITAIQDAAIAGNWVTITPLEVSDNSVGVTIGTAGMPFIAGSRIRCIQLSSLTDTQDIVDFPLSAIGWANGTMSIVFNNAAADAVYGVYLYTPDGSRVSNILPLVL